jgi:hypothetical protein
MFASIEKGQEVSTGAGDGFVDHPRGTLRGTGESSTLTNASNVDVYRLSLMLATALSKCGLPGRARRPRERQGRG